MRDIKDLIRALRAGPYATQLSNESFMLEAADAIEKLQAQRTEVAPSRDSIIRECRRVVLEVAKDAQEAALAKDATDYVSGYRDAVVDCDEELRALLDLPPAGYGPNAKECSGKIQDGGEPQSHQGEDK